MGSVSIHIECLHLPPDWSHSSPGALAGSCFLEANVRLAAEAVIPSNIDGLALNEKGLAIPPSHPSIKKKKEMSFLLLELNTSTELMVPI